MPIFCKYIQDTIIHNIYENEDNPLQEIFFIQDLLRNSWKKVRFSSIIHIKMKKKLMAYYGKNNDGLIINFLPWTCIVIAHIILKNQNILVQELWFGILTSQILTAKSHSGEPLCPRFKKIPTLGKRNFFLVRCRDLPK